MTTSPTTQVWLCCALIFCIAIAIILPGLSSNGFWDPFEIDLVERLVRDQSGYRASLSEWSVQRAMEIGSVGELSARLPSALLGIATSILCFVWMARAGSLPTAMIATLFLMSAPVFILQSRLALSSMPILSGQLLLVYSVSELAFSRGKVVLLWTTLGVFGFILTYLASGDMLVVFITFLALASACARVKRWRSCFLLIALSIVIALLALLSTDTFGSGLQQLPENGSWDQILEPIAFGSFPWSIFLPIAIFCAPATPNRNGFISQVAVFWIVFTFLPAGFQRFSASDSLFLALPAMAFLVAQWVCHHSDRIHSHEDSIPIHHLAVLGSLMLMLGRDLAGFSERLAAISFAAETVPRESIGDWHNRAFWLVALAMIAGFGLRYFSRARKWMPWTVAVVSTLSGMMIAHSWIPHLSKKLSHSHLVTLYLELQTAQEPLLNLGKIPPVVSLYVPEARALRQTSIVEALIGKPRVFAFLAKNALCSIRQRVRTKGQAPYILDTSESFALISNQYKIGEPLSDDFDSVLSSIATDTPNSFDAITFGHALRLYRVDMPTRAKQGSEFELRLYYQVIAKPRRKWKIFAHFDGAGIRFQGDHWPIDNLCASNFWNPGDFVSDVFSVKAGDRISGKGKYRLWTGFFSGSKGNWDRMPVTSGAHKENRAFVGEIEIY